MSRPFRRLVHSLTALSLASTLFLMQGCKPSAAGSGVDKRAQRKARVAAKRGPGNRRAQLEATFNRGFTRSDGGTKGASEEYKPSYGYIVKGTDFLTYWPCDSVGYYYLSASQNVNAKISQQYKFSAPRPYLPMYAELKVRYVNDTLTRGERVFSRYVEVSDYVPRSRDDAKCKGPTRATLSDEMQRLDQFKVELPAR